MNTALLSWLLITLCWIQSPEQPDAAQVLIQRARQATGLTLARIPDEGIRLIGEGTYAGMPAQFLLQFTRQGHFVQKVNARISTGLGFDGTNAWVKDLGGEERLQELADRRNTIFMGLIYTGLWLDPSSGMEFSAPREKSTSAEVNVLHFTHPASEQKGTLQLSSTTGLPVSISLQREGREVTLRWSDYRDSFGMKLPGMMELLSSGEVVEKVKFTTIEPAPLSPISPYLAAVNKPKDVRFDSTQPAELIVKRAKTGHLLVKPLVNGKDVGWFIFDSGAGAHVLAKGTVKELGLEAFGELPAIGVGGTVKTNFSKPNTITLGRAEFQEPFCIALDLAFLDSVMGDHIAGIIGYGAFHRCIVEVDMEKNSVALFDPSNYDEARAQNRWQKLYQTARVACVEAEFEGHKGIFKLDTGAAGSTVAIHAPIVEKFKLLEGRETSDTVTGGVGGMLKARKGKLQYFELGGHRAENIEATFATSRIGAFDSTETLGNIGGELVKPFRIIFDYQQKRIAFVKR